MIPSGHITSTRHFAKMTTAWLEQYTEGQRVKLESAATAGIIAREYPALADILDRIAGIVEADRMGKPGALDAITDLLEKAGYKFEA